MSYKVKLKTFEGPFDLLVYLIENARVDIYDIAISEITDQYMAYLEEMQKLDVAIASTINSLPMATSSFCISSVYGVS